MNPLSSFERSWQLFQSSIYIVRKHPKLLAFPALIAIFTLIISAFFLIPIGAVFFLIRPHDNKVFSASLLVLYPISMFAATFCNVAFYSQIMAALKGQNVSIRQGLEVAKGRFKSILVWSLFASLVGLILRQIQERFGLLGRIITGFLGLVWSVASVFAIPIIILEEPTSNPMQILEKSAGTIKRTWGEMLIGYVGLGMMSTIVGLVAIFIMIGSAILAAVLSNFWILIPIGLLWITALFAYFYLANIASQAYLCALYLYASEGIVPEPYSKQLLDQAWKVKKG